MRFAENIIIFPPEGKVIHLFVCRSVAFPAPSPLDPAALLVRSDSKCDDEHWLDEIIQLIKLWSSTLGACRSSFGQSIPMTADLQITLRLALPRFPFLLVAVKLNSTFWWIPWNARSFPASNRHYATKSSSFRRVFPMKIIIKLFLLFVKQMVSNSNSFSAPQLPELWAKTVGTNRKAKLFYFSSKVSFLFGHNPLLPLARAKIWR